MSTQIEKDIRALCIAIEQLPASKQQTTISVMASELELSIKNSLKERVSKKACDGCLYDLSAYIEYPCEVCVGNNLWKSNRVEASE